MGSVALGRVAFGLAVALSVPVGCGHPVGARNGPGGGVSSASAVGPSATISAAAALAAAARKLNEQAVSSRVTTIGAMHVMGQVDPVARTARMTVSVISVRPAVGMELIVADRATYAKIAGMPDVPDDWMRFDSGALSGTQLDVIPKDDPAGASQLMAGLVTVERDGDRGFRGTLDLTKAPTSAAYNLKGLGSKAQAVPFTALVDEQGRLTVVNIELAAVVPGARNIKAVYVGFGQPVSVDPPPAAETVDAPANVVRHLQELTLGSAAGR